MEEKQEINVVELSKNIAMYKVNSSNVSAMGYDEGNKLMKVIFKGNASYVYENVEPETFNNIIKAESLGKALTESVTKHKEKYKYTKL